MHNMIQRIIEPNNSVLDEIKQMLDHLNFNEDQFKK